MLRSYSLDRAKEDVLRHMKLRKPQADSLKAFDEIYRDLQDPLPKLSQDDLIKTFREHRPSWDFERGFPRMTCALATGVGKTRLMGAFMAYLHKAGESSNFLLVAPRTTIIDKLTRETQSGNSDYIFVDPSFVEQPVVYHSGNFDSFDPREEEMGSGPTIWILSPQAMAGSSKERSLRFHRESEYLGSSPQEYLQSLEDLVVFFDESHHMGHAGEGEEVPAWTQAVRDLSPRMLFAMTASPRSSSDILHDYSLPHCLRDGLYTKGVRVISQERPDEVDDWEWDKVTIRYTLERLRTKERAIDHFQRENDTDEEVKPVALLFAKDTSHAEDVTRWLESQLGSEEVLLVHSGMNESDYLPRLLSVEDPSNPVRVIVNVYQLSEGWDVDNVYVTAPLRANATVQGVIQTMGRGLRLPYGDRVGREEVDKLDVLCFGKQTMDEIIDRVLEEGFGSREDQEVYMEVSEKENVEEEPERRDYELTPDQDVEITLPNVDWRRPRVDLSGLTLPRDYPGEPVAIDMSDTGTVEQLDGRPGFEREAFLSTVTSLAVQRKEVVGSVTDASHIREAVSEYLEDEGYGEEDLVDYDPEFVARLCVKAIDNILEEVDPEYVRSSGEMTIAADPIEVQIPDRDDVPVHKSNGWNSNLKGVPISGWSQCAHKAVPFDTKPEFKVAKVLDRSTEEVDWWMRNLRKIFQLQTPAGGYAPDFMFLLQVDGEKIILEIKGRHLADGDSSAAIKARAAEAWCEAMNNLGQGPWRHWFVLGSDAERAQSIGDLRSYASEWKRAHAI